MTRLRTLWSRIDRFLVAILLTVGLASLLPARGDAAVALGSLTDAAIALLFFMHLSKNRGLMWFVGIFTVAVLIMLQYGWTDSYRLLDGVQWAR